jgi:hypothetical protein
VRRGSFRFSPGGPMLAWGLRAHRELGRRPGRNRRVDARFDLALVHRYRRVSEGSRAPRVETAHQESVQAKR